MSLYLAIESSGSIGSVALFEDGVLIGNKTIVEERAHSRLLAGMISDLMFECKSDFRSLDAVGISAGPGSYTGLRIGASIAKGICFTANIPLVSINTMEIMASSFKVGTDQLICTMIDARRMEVYTATFDSNLRPVRLPKALVLDESSYNDLLSDHTINFIGDGAEKANTVIHSERALFFPQVAAKAKDMEPLINSKFNSGDFEDISIFEPDYLKPFYSPKPKSN